MACSPKCKGEYTQEHLWHRAIVGRAVEQPVLCIVVPLLALPQVTHYVLDGFIWKVRKDEFRWSNEGKAAQASSSTGG